MHAAAEEKETEDELRAETIEKADQFIEDAINRLDWDDLQELVAGILRAMGYRTSVAGPGSDRGVDIFASPDGIGLQEPRIFVEVKHRTETKMGAKEIRAFLGGRKPGDKCLYVSTGGFAKDAHYEADRASVPLTLVPLPAAAKAARRPLRGARRGDPGARAAQEAVLAGDVARPFPSRAVDTAMPSLPRGRVRAGLPG